MNPYHLFISYILSDTIYKNDYKILILSDHYAVLKKAYEQILFKSDVWNEVILIEDKNTVKGLQKLKEVDFNSIDIMHYFTYSSYNSVLFTLIKERTKVILTDEGIMTYFIKECLEYRKVKGIDINRISEVWVWDKRLYTSKFNKPVKNIGLESYFKNKEQLKEICKGLNELFGYKHKSINSDLIFFDQPLTKAGIITEKREKSLLYTMLNTVMKYKVSVKKHPSDSYDKYGNIGVEIIDDIGVPWELVILNEYMDNESNLYNKVFLSYNSAALINTKIFYGIFEIPCTSIFMYKLIKINVNGYGVDIQFQKFIDKVKLFYPKGMYDIKSIEEMKSIIELKRV